VPTALFAAPEDWADAALTARIDRAALELVALMRAGIASTIRIGNAAKYQTQLGSKNDPGIDFDSDLMRLAAGGGKRPGPRAV
jgi:FMN reductase